MKFSTKEILSELKNWSASPAASLSKLIPAPISPSLNRRKIVGIGCALFPGMDCPHCHLFNPKCASICDCGFDFQTKQLGSSLLTEASQESRPNNALWLWVPLTVVSMVYWLDAGNAKGYLWLLRFCLFGAAGFYSLVRYSSRRSVRR